MLARQRVGEEADDGGGEDQGEDAERGAGAREEVVRAGRSEVVGDGAAVIVGKEFFVGSSLCVVGVGPWSGGAGGRGRC